jgi:hypothetical protein
MWQQLQTIRNRPNLQRDLIWSKELGTQLRWACCAHSHRCSLIEVKSHPVPDHKFYVGPLLVVPLLHQRL